MEYEACVQIDDDVVKEYVRDNYSVDDVYPEAEILEHIRRDKNIEDVYTRAELEAWAIDNGYLKET